MQPCAEFTVCPGAMETSLVSRSMTPFLDQFRNHLHPWMFTVDGWKIPAPLTQPPAQLVARLQNGTFRCLCDITCRRRSFLSCASLCFLRMTFLMASNIANDNFYESCLRMTWRCLIGWLRITSPVFSSTRWTLRTTTRCRRGTCQTTSCSTMPQTRCYDTARPLVPQSYIQFNLTSHSQWGGGGAT